MEKKILHRLFHKTKTQKGKGFVIPLSFRYALRLSFVRIQRRFFNTWWKYATLNFIVIGILGTGLFFVQENFTKAATFGWSQASWMGGASTDVADHTNNQTGWDKYVSQDVSVTSNASVTFTPSTVSDTDTSHTDFSAGALSDTQVTGLGSSSKVLLDGPKSSGISSGYYDTCAVSDDGSVSCWGRNIYGELGDNTTTQRSAPVKVLGGDQGGTYFTNVSQIALGYTHTCAVTTDGSAYCWGDNTNGQLGDNTTTQRNTPVKVLGGAQGGTYLTNVSQIAVGYTHTCAVTTDGSAYCWGSNSSAQLGDNTTTQRSTPVKVLGGAQGGTYLTNVSQVTVGNSYTCALVIDGSAYCWGSNSSGKLGDNTATQRNTPIKVLGGAQGGTYLINVSQITASNNSYTCALVTDGSVYCWGDNTNGQLGDNTTTQRNTPIKVLGGAQGGTYLTNVSQVSTGSSHTCALTTDGSVYCWGDNINGQLGDNTTTQRLTPVQVLGGAQGGTYLANVSRIAVGQNYTCAVTTDGSVYCWGVNSSGQLGDNTTTQRNTPVIVSYSLDDIPYFTNVTQVSAGSSHTCAVTTDSSVYCWGYNANGQLGDNTTTQRNTPIKVLGGAQGGTYLTDVSQIIVGQKYTCALTTDGSVYCWGDNSNGQLGDNTTTQRNTPIKVLGGAQGGTYLTNVSQITVIEYASSGFFHTCAATTDGFAYCWGSNSGGALGDNTTTQRNTPIKVLGGAQGGTYLTNVSQMVVGYLFTCALTADGSVYCWGDNSNGQLGDNTTTQRSTPVKVLGGDQGGAHLTNVNQIDAGYRQVCAVTVDGYAYCWGRNSSGQLGDNTTTNRYTPIKVLGGAQGGTYLTNVSQVASGDQHDCAVTADSSIYCWGGNTSGQLGDNTTTQRNTPVKVLGGEQGGTYLTNVSQVSGGDVHTCTVITNGSVYCWGSNGNGRLGDNTTTQRNTPVRTVSRSSIDLTFTSYASSGTFISDTIDFSESIHVGTLAFTVAIPTNTEAKFQIAGNTDNTTWDFVGPDGTSSTYFSSSGTQIPQSLSNNRYFKYKAFLSTTDTAVSPEMDDVTVSAYPLTELTSSVYNSLDSANIVSGIKVSGNESGGSLANSTVYAQVRAGSDSDPTSGNWTDWCGPDSCNGQDFFTFTNSTLGTTLPFSVGSTMLSGSNEQYLQYKVILGSKNGSSAPTVTGVTVQYVVNATPQVSNVTATQGSDGVITIGYDLADADNATDAVSFLADIGATLNESLDATDTTLTLSGVADLPNAGTIQIDNEQMSYSGKSGSDLTGVTRSTNNTRATTHSLSSVVWYKATAVSGSVGNSVPVGNGKSGSWTVKTDLPGKYYAATKIKVTANDGEAANQINSADSSTFVIDTANPIVSSFIVDSRSDAAHTLSISAIDDTLSGLKMKLSNESDLSADGTNSDSGNWIDYATTKNWNLSGDPETIYYQFKDVYGNVSNAGSISSIVLSDKPQNIVYQDVSTAESSEWREFVAWSEIAEPSLGFGQYNIYRSQDGTNYSLVSTETDKGINFYIDTNLDTNSTYYYKVAAQDQSGNITNYSNAVQDRPNGQGGSDLTPPTISSVSSSGITTQSATLTWNTDELANSTVEYITTTGGDFTDAPTQGVSTVTDNASGLGSHRVVLTNLTPGTIYYYRVKSTDPSGNEATSTSGANGYSFTTLTGPAISDVSTASVQESSATIVWATNIDADSYVYYSMNPDLSDASQIGSDITTKTHSVSLSGLLSNTQYYYSVKSDVAVDDNGGQYYTFRTSSLVSGPGISNVLVTDLTYKTATIAWDTDTESNSLVDYGVDSGSFDQTYGSSSDITTTHSITLPDLKPLTRYFFQVSSQDAYNNRTTKTTDNEGLDLSFTTVSAGVDSNNNGIPDQLEDISGNIGNALDASEYTETDVQNALSDVGGNLSISSSGPSSEITSNTTAVISWITNSEASGKVVYWEEGKNQDTAVSIDEGVAPSTKHEVTIKNLNAQTSYSYYVVSTSLLGQEATSDTKTFTTQDAAQISGISIMDVTLESAIVHWITTDSIKSSLVEYGTDVKYGEKKTSDGSTTHAVTLDNLTPGQEYHLRISGEDADGESIVSNDYSFITSELPIISDISIREVTTEGATVSWKTNTKTDTLVEYKVVGEEEGLNQGVLEMTIDHTMQLTNLVPGVTYEIRVASKDAFSNRSESDPLTFSTNEDTQDPQMENIKSDTTLFPGKESRVQTIISWSSNKSTNSFLLYKKDNVDGLEGIGDKLINGNTQELNGWKILKNDDLSFRHMFVVTEFEPSSIYYFKVAGIDKQGKISISDNYSLLTPAKEKSVFDLIVKNFEDTFGWLNLVGW